MLEKEYWSIESTPKDYRYKKSDMKFDGARISETDKNTRYVLYTAPDGWGWYETKMRSGSGWIPAEEAIFKRRTGTRPGKRKRPA